MLHLRMWIVLAATILTYMFTRWPTRYNWSGLILVQLVVSYKEELLFCGFFGENTSVVWRRVSSM